MTLGDISSERFEGYTPEECYKKYYSWDSRLVKETKSKTNVIDKFLYFNESRFPYYYTLVVIYFKEG
jgi:hypothetical protein